MRRGQAQEPRRPLDSQPIPGTIGIAHTRWATHGAPTETNAHPHACDRVAVVHNGIIENLSELRAELQSQGFMFVSETDTEVVPQLVAREIYQGLDPAEAVAATLPQLKRAFALSDARRHVRRRARRAARRAALWRGRRWIASDAIALRRSPTR